jgi:hypothetical protein
MTTTCGPRSTRRAVRVTGRGAQRPGPDRGEFVVDGLPSDLAILDLYLDTLLIYPGELFGATNGSPDRARSDR